MFKNNIVDLLKDLRKETNVSQDELANYIWVSRLTYISAENWKRKFRENEMYKIAEFFEKPISDFLNKKKNKEDPKRKLKDLILYISDKYEDKENFWKTMLNKLLYFSDFNYYEWTWNMISWSNYKKLPYWPVPENISDVLNEMIIDWEIVMKNERIWDFVIQKIISLNNSDIQFFNDVDLINKQKRENYTPYDDLPWSKQIVDDVLVKYEKWTTKSLSDLSHEDTPYKAIKNYWEVIKPELVFYRSKSFIINHHNL